MRTFIAIRPPNSLLNKLESYCRDVLSPAFPGVRWVIKNNLHLTLRFLGEIPPDKLPALSVSVSGVAGTCSAFALNTERVGYFGSPHNPRVVWLGLKKCVEIQELAKCLENSLDKAGFGRSDKPFRAHLTLARIKRPLSRAVDWQSIPGFRYPDPWPVTEIEIIGSTLTPDGPIYETLDTLKLS